MLGCFSIGINGFQRIKKKEVDRYWIFGFSGQLDQEIKLTGLVFL
jgi:hypothetical protein